MRAIILATGYCPNNPLSDHSPAPLLPLVDRPFLQHVVEFLVDQGVHEFDFVLSHLPEKIEAFLGDGTRWGSTFRFHLVRLASQPYSILTSLPLDATDAPILLVHADRLLDVQLAETKPSTQQSQSPVVFYWLDQDDASHEQRRWAGWAWVSGGMLLQLAKNGQSETFAKQLWGTAQHHGTLVEVAKPLSLESCDTLLHAHQMLLEKQFSGLMLKGREIETGVWISRNVRLHPTAQIVPPVYIGENCWIEEHVTLGPYATVGRDCVVNPQSTIRQSVVFPGSYVGEGLELMETFVDRNRLVNIRVGTDVTVTDDFILGSLFTRSFPQLARDWLSRLIALLLLLGLWPVLVLTAVFLRVTRSGPVLSTQEVVRLPVSPGQVARPTFPLWSFAWVQNSETEKSNKPLTGIRHLLFEFLPGLINVAKGDLHLVGVASRTQAMIDDLPLEWRALYLQSKAGLISEAYVQYGGSANQDELYAAEAFYAVQASFRHDLQLILGYVRQLVRGS